MVGGACNFFRGIVFILIEDRNDDHALRVGQTQHADTPFRRVCPSLLKLRYNGECRVGPTLAGELYKRRSSMQRISCSFFQLQRILSSKCGLVVCVCKLAAQRVQDRPRRGTSICISHRDRDRDRDRADWTEHLLN